MKGHEIMYILLGFFSVENDLFYKILIEVYMAGYELRDYLTTLSRQLICW